MYFHQTELRTHSHPHLRQQLSVVASLFVTFSANKMFSLMQVTLSDTCSFLYTTHHTAWIRVMG